MGLLPVTLSRGEPYSYLGTHQSLEEERRAGLLLSEGSCPAEEAALTQEVSEVVKIFITHSGPGFIQLCHCFLNPFSACFRAVVVKLEHVLN